MRAHVRASVVVRQARGAPASVAPHVGAALGAHRSAGRAPQRLARTTAQSLSCGRVVAMSVRDRRDFATVVVRRARPDSGANAGPCAMLRRSRSLLG